MDDSRGRMHVSATAGSLLREIVEAFPPGATPHRLHLWEIRARAGASDSGKAWLDGGARVEDLDPSTATVRRAWFAAGAGPRAVAALAEGALDPDPDGWRAAAEWIDSEVASLHVAARGACERAARDGAPELAAETRARLRALSSGPDVPVAVSLDGSLRLVARAPRGGRVLCEEVLPGLEHPERALLDAAARLHARARAAAADAGDPADPEPGSRRGPVVMTAAAAAWWVHEMAHAAFEGIGDDVCRGGRSVCIREVPADAPWPAGFAIDDSGADARASLLWGGRDAAPPDAGHRRRASIRDRAVPGPAFTRLVADPGAGASMVDVPEGTLALTSVRAGRLDPPSGTILLHADGLAIVRGGALRPCAGEGVVMVGVDDGWRGLSVIRDGPPAAVISALCTRGGRTAAVMVGAQTLVLDSVWFMAN